MVVMGVRGRVYSWCGCRDLVAGRRLGSSCPRRGQRGHGSWYVSLELPAGLDGSRRRIRRGGFPTRCAAREALGRLLVPAPGDPAGRLMTAGQWLACWLDSHSTARASTVRSYAAPVRLYLDPYLGQVLLADLSAAHVQAMFTAIARQHLAAGRPVSAATLARIRATLRAALNAAIRAGRITGNPACQVRLPPGRRPRARVWTPARVEEWQRTGARPPVAVWTPCRQRPS